MDGVFTQIDFGPLKEYLDNDDVTDISYSNGGQVWLKTLSKGVYKVDNVNVNNPLMEKVAFQCANAMGKSFNMAEPFLDAESAELRMNFVHDSIAKNGIAVLIRKTPAKIRLKKDKILEEKYIQLDIHDFLLKCVEGHCNIIVSGETGSGKTEFVKYLASHTKENEKLITIEDTLELHLDRIFPTRDIVAMKTNNIASYSDVLVTCMRQNPRWILLSEVRSAEAVMAVRNSISSGHNILSTIHADKAEAIPSRMYSLLESNLDIDQFLRSIHRYVQLGVHIKGYYSKELQRFHREVAEVVEFYVTEDNEAKYNILYKKTPDGKVSLNNPSKYLLGYLESQGVIMNPNILVKDVIKDASLSENATILQGGESVDVIAQPSVAPVVTPNVIAQPSVAPVVTPNVVAQPSVAPVVTPNVVSQPSVAPVVTPNVVAQPSVAPVVTPNVVAQPSVAPVVTPNVVAQPSVAPVVTPNVVAQPSVAPVVTPNVVAQPSVAPVVTPNVVAQPSVAPVVTPNVVAQPSVAPVVTPNVVAQPSVIPISTSDIGS